MASKVSNKKSKGAKSKSKGASKKKASKKKASKKKKAPASMPSGNPAAGVDPMRLDSDDAKKRIARIYDLKEQAVALREKWAALNEKAKAAKAEMHSAELLLVQEIDEQRLGPGPLFDNPQV